MRRFSRRCRHLFGATMLAALSASVLAQRGAPTEGEWPYYSGDMGTTKYSPLAQITQDNVTNLRIAWRRPSVDPAATASLDGFKANSSFRSTPLMIRAGKQYLVAPIGGAAHQPELVAFSLP